MMKKNLSKEQLFDYFSGKSSLLIKQKIEELLQDTANQELYYQWLEEWERQHIYWKPDSEEEFSLLRQRITASATNNAESETGISAIRPIWMRTWWVAAAASLLLLVSAYLLEDQWRYQHYTTAYGAIQNIKLTDGTLVTLNANSTLRVPRFGFGADTRQVELDGEAYFSVTHTAKDQKFVVKTNEDFSVEVLGTEFAVRKRSQGMQVVLDKGKVKIHYGQSKPPITMKPGDLVTLNPQGQAKIERTNSPQKYSAWRVHKFVFDKTSLREITLLLQDNFGLQTEDMTSELAQRSISGEIEAKNADELLEALSEILDLKITKNNQKIIIRETNN